MGGDLNYIARELAFEFLRPVFTGDSIRWVVTITHLEQAEEKDLTRMEAAWICRNQHDKEVLLGHTRAVIRSPC